MSPVLRVASAQGMRSNHRAGRGPGHSMVVNSERLLNGEMQRFNSGENSLFHVNRREVPLIETRLGKALFALDLDPGTLWVVRQR